LLLVVEAAETTASPPLALDSLSGERDEDMATVLARRLVASSPGERKAEALGAKLMSSARPRACIDARGDNLTVTQPTEYLATGEAVPSPLPRRVNRCEATRRRTGSRGVGRLACFTSMQHFHLRFGLKKIPEAATVYSIVSHIDCHIYL
jgi:hypothetical protein